MFFIVKGSGLLRYGDETREDPRGRRDLLPDRRTGNRASDRQRLRRGLAYLSVSTMLPAEVCEYPDSKKIGAFGGGLRHMTAPGTTWTIG
jgi:hypothetical protein